MEGEHNRPLAETLPKQEDTEVAAPLHYDPRERLHYISHSQFVPDNFPEESVNNLKSAMLQLLVARLWSDLCTNQWFAVKLARTREYPDYVGPTCGKRVEVRLYIQWVTPSISVMEWRRLPE